MRQLTPLDVQFLALEDARNHGHVAGLGIFDPSTAPGGRLDLAAVLELVGSRIHLLPPFRWRLVEVPLGLDHPYWVEDPDFDLEYHVRELALPEPGDERQLAEQVARLHARRLDRAHPLWEMYVISGLAGGHVALFTKVHHAAVDGLSGAEILAALLDLSPEGRDLPEPDPAPPAHEVPGQLGMLARGVAGLPRQPLRALRGLPRTLAHLDANPAFRVVPGARQVAAAVRALPGVDVHTPDGGFLEMPQAKAPRTVFNAPLSAHRRVAYSRLPLADVKTVKNALGVTVNDVVVTVCAAAVRRVLADAGELPDEALVALVPLSVRTPEQAGTYGNRVSGMLVPIPTDVPDPLERLRQAHEVLDQAKTRHRAVPAEVMLDTASVLPAALVTRASRLGMALMARLPVEPVMNLVVSNVPGPPVPLYLGGARLVAYHPISVVTDMGGLNITVFSYLDALDVGVVVDRQQLADAWLITDAMSEALDQLLALVASGESDEASEKPVRRRRQQRAQ